MIHPQRVAEDVYRVEIRLPYVESVFAVYFIRRGKGVLIEPGPTATIPFIQEAMDRLNMKEPAYIVPTHIHLDHGGAVGSLARLFPGATIVLHPRGSRHVIEPSRLVESTRMAFGDDFEDRYGPILPVPESQVYVPQDGEILPVNGTELQILYAPGHAPHHVAIYDFQTKGLFCGEALGMPVSGNGSSPLPAAAPPSYDLEVYLETMEKLRQVGPRILFYSHHGGVGTNPHELISQAEENTRMFGEIIGKSVEVGETIEAIDSKIRDDILKRLGTRVEPMDRGMTLRGFISYFEKKRSSPGTR